MIRSPALQSIISILLIALACACAVQQVRQLDRFKAWTVKGNDAAIVEANVDCDSSDQACAQLHLIRGMACYHQGKQDVEPKLRYQCAIDELQQGVTLARQDGKPASDNAPYLKALLESIRERQDLSSSWNESSPYTALLRDHAAEFRQSFPNEPEGYYYGATALFSEANQRLAQDSSPAEACALLSQASDLLKADSQSGALAESFKQTARQIESTRRSECST